MYIAPIIFDWILVKNREGDLVMGMDLVRVKVKGRVLVNVRAEKSDWRKNNYAILGKQTGVNSTTPSETHSKSAVSSQDISNIIKHLSFSFWALS